MDPQRRSAIGRTAFVIIIAVMSPTGCGKKPTRIGSNPAVTPTRLVGYRLTDIKHDLSWRFDEDSVVIDNNNQPLYAHVFEDMGFDARSDAKQIEAKWTLDQARNVLVLSDLKVDGEPLADKAELPIGPAGPIRINLGNRQYNTFRSEPSTGAEPPIQLTRADLDEAIRRHKTTAKWHYDAKAHPNLVGTWRSDDRDRSPLVFSPDGKFQCGFTWRNGKGRLATGMFAVNEEGLVVGVASAGSSGLGVFYRMENGLLYGSRGPSPRVAWKKVSDAVDMVSGASDSE